MNNLRVLLVDDEPLLLESLEIILTLNRMEIAGMAHDGYEALDVLSMHQCDLALVDLNMKGMGGIELISHLKRDYPDVKILVLTTFYDDRSITQCIRAEEERRAAIFPCHVLCLCKRPVKAKLTARTGICIVYLQRLRIVGPCMSFPIHTKEEHPVLCIY